MRQRFLVRLLVLLAIFLAAAGQAHAHKLEAQCFFRPGWQIQVEGWYETGDSPVGAKVKVFRADGQLLSEGKLDKNGVFVFPFTEVEALRVVVSSTGHRVEVKIPAETLTHGVACTVAGCLTPEKSPFLRATLLVPASMGDEKSETTARSQPLADRGSSFPIVGVITGIGILLAVALLFRWLSMRSVSDASAKRR